MSTDPIQPISSGNPISRDLASGADIPDASPKFIIPELSFCRDRYRDKYQAFRNVLGLTYNFNNLNPGNIKWADTSQALIQYPPIPKIKHNTNSGSVSIRLDPTDPEKPGESIAGHLHYAATWVRDVQPLSLLPNLRKYIVRGMTGVPEPQSIFEKDKTLEELLKDSDFIPAGFRLDDTTPVVESLVMLPFAENREFITEFAPNITAGKRSQFILINADKLSLPNIIYDGGASGPFLKREGAGTGSKKVNWKADRIPDLSDIEKLLLPSSAGHMILIEIPVKDKQQEIDLSYLLNRDYGFGGDNLKSMGGFGGGFATRSGGLMLGGSTKSSGGTVSGVSISGGSTRKDNTARTDEEFTYDPTRQPIIYHFNFVGFKPSQVDKVNAGLIESLVSNIGNFNFQNN